MLVKTLLIFIGVMVLSCIFNSVGIWMGLLPNYPPYPWGTRVDVPLAAKQHGVKRDEQNMPEVDITNGMRPNQYIFQVHDSNERSQADYPYCANF